MAKPFTKRNTTIVQRTSVHGTPPPFTETNAIGRCSGTTTESSDIYIRLFR